MSSCNRKAENKQTSKELDTVTTIRVLKLEQSVAAIIPANYFRKKDWLNEHSREKGFFTPDEKTIKEIEEMLPEQSSVIDSYWGEPSGWQSVFKINAKYTHMYDKQYMGYIDAKKDSIVDVTLFNFESDPCKFREEIEKRHIGGCDGWFNTNTCTLEYNKRTKKFSSIMD